VHIFKSLVLILFISSLFSQSKLIVLDNSDTLNVKPSQDIEFILDSMLVSSDKIGNYLKLDKIVSDSVYNYKIVENEVYLDTIIFSNNEIRNSVANQIYKSILDTKPFKETNKQFDLINRSTHFINDSSTIAYGLYDNYNIGTIINAKTNFNNYFAGLIGASNNNENEWLVNGQIDIHLENQWRTANLINLHWKRMDEESQILNLQIEEPHPFGLPIGVSVGYNQNLREGSFVNNESSVGIIKTVPGIAKFGFGGKNIKINSTAKGDSLGIPNLTSQSIYLSGNIDRRNDYWLPNKGYFLMFNTDIGKRVIHDSSSISLSIGSEFEKYFKFSKRANFLFKVIGQGIWVDKGYIHEGELIRYGGSNNLRGYIEDNFKSEWAIIPSLELSLDFGLSQRITLFTDIAIQEEYNPLPYGLGIGLTQITKNSILKLFYGIGRGDKIKNGKIHIQFLTRL